MKRKLLFGILMALGMGQLMAQTIPTPLVDVDWVDSHLKYAAKGSYTVNGTIRCYGTGGASGVRDNCSNWLKNSGTSDSLVWCRNATNSGSMQDPSTGKWLGYSDYDPYAYFLMFYNDNDAVGKAFASKFTLESTLRMDNLYAGTRGSDGTTSYACTSKIISSQESGGWSLQMYPSKKGNGLAFDYVENTNQEGGYTAKSQWANTDTTLMPGKFYHVAVVVDNTLGGDSYYKIFVNGQLMKTQSLTGNPWCPPNIGTTRRSKNMWFDMGGDTRGENGPDYCENSPRVTFADVKIYSDVLTDDQVATRYASEDVQEFVNPTIKMNNDLLFDAVFGADGSAYDASIYNTIFVAGKPSTEYNGENKKYQMVCDGTNKNFFYRNMSIEDTYVMGEGFAFEAYCQSAVTTPTATMSPISIQQAGGLGFEMQTSGKVAFNCNTVGFSYVGGSCRADAPFCGTATGFLNTQYNHYLLTYDRLGRRGTMYINGVEVANSDAKNPPMEVIDYLDFPAGKHQFIPVGGDANNTNPGVRTTCDFPFNGNIVSARLWGKAITAEDAAALYAQATTTSKTITVGAAGYATTVLPFAAVVPANAEVYVIESESETEAKAALYAEAGDVIPYGTPIIVKAAAGDYAFEAADMTSAIIKAAPSANLLVGSFATKKVAANEVYVLADNAGTAEFQPAEALTIPAQKAWLPITAAAPKAKKIDFGTVTAVSSVKTSADKDVYFDLQGRKIQNPTRGLYIKNGQKIFVK